MAEPDVAVAGFGGEMPVKGGRRRTAGLARGHDACHTAAPTPAVSDRVGAAVTLRGGTPWQSSSSTSSSSEEDRPVR